MCFRKEVGKTLRRVVLTKALLVSVALAAPQTGFASTFFVNSTGDQPDINPGNGICETVAGGGVCTLRAAIQETNALPNSPAATPDEIRFNVFGSGVMTIFVASSLPVITDNVIINGYTQPGASPNSLAVGNDANLLVVISGSAAPLGANGLTINTNNSTIRGLVISGFRATASGVGGRGIAILAGSNSNVIEGNFLGTNAAGSSAVANAVGVEILDASDNLIGGTTPAARNLLSGNGYGVVVLGTVPSTHTALRNLVRGNYVGTNAA